MITRRILFIMLTITGLYLVGMNLALHWLARNSIPRSLLARIQNAPQIGTAAVGNSLIASGFNPQAFSAGWKDEQSTLHPFNAGLGGSGPTEQYLITRKIMRQHPGMNRMVYGFFDFSLTDATALPLSEMFGNRTLAFIAEPELASNYLTTGFMQQLTYRTVARIPLFVDRGSLWARVENLRRFTEELGMPAQTRNSYGRNVDFKALESSNITAFLEKCRKPVEANQALCAANADLFKEVHAKNIPLYVVEMPMPTAHRNGCYDSPEWQRYREHIQTLLKPYDAVYITASDWMPDADFADPLHLNEHGAAEFSERLGATIRLLEKGQMK